MTAQKVCYIYDDNRQPAGSMLYCSRHTHGQGSDLKAEELCDAGSVNWRLEHLNAAVFHNEDECHKSV